MSRTYQVVLRIPQKKGLIPRIKSEAPRHILRSTQKSSLRFVSWFYGDSPLFHQAFIDRATVVWYIHVSGSLGQKRNLHVLSPSKKPPICILFPDGLVIVDTI